jgi:fucose 4-O-acetylase-like acetyltransferase
LTEPRDPYFDNAKALLVCLVVIGHLNDYWGLEGLSLAGGHFIYTFHMAAFTFLAGLFSRSFDTSPRRVRALVADLLIPYVIVEIAITLLRWAISGELVTTILEPRFGLWFLVALFSWRLATPILRLLRWPLPIAIVISLTSGFDVWGGRVLSMGRILAFLPFFVAGVMLDDARLARLKEVLRRRGWRIAAVCALLLIAAACFVWRNRIERPWFEMSPPFATDQLWLDFAMRPVVLALGAVGGLAFLALAPATRCWLTVIGENSLVVYLVHLPIAYVAQRWAPIPEAVTALPGSYTPLLLAAVLGVTLTALLGNRPVANVLRKVISPPPLGRLLLGPTPSA